MLTLMLKVDQSPTKGDDKAFGEYLPFLLSTTCAALLTTQFPRLVAPESEVRIKALSPEGIRLERGLDIRFGKGQSRRQPSAKLSIVHRTLSIVV